LSIPEPAIDRTWFADDSVDGEQTNMGVGVGEGVEV